MNENASPIGGIVLPPEFQKTDRKIAYSTLGFMLLAIGAGAAIYAMQSSLIGRAVTLMGTGATLGIAYAAGRKVRREVGEPYAEELGEKTVKHYKAMEKCNL